MARVQPQPPPEDLAWEELEETLDEVEEEEKESEGGKEGREEERQAEDAGGSKNGQGRNKDPHNREGLELANHSLFFTHQLNSPFYFLNT